MLMIEPHSAAAARFCVANFDSSARRLSSSTALFIPRIKYRKSGGRVTSGKGIRAAAKKHSDYSSGSGPMKQNEKPQRYHPSEEIAESELLLDEEATLTPAETTRTIIEVNSKATLMFSGMVSEEIHENIFWPDLPYLTDEHGNIYFQVKNDDDTLQTLTTEETIVQAIIGIDTAEMISEMEALDHADFDLGMDELDEDDSDFNDDEEDENDDSDDSEDEDDKETEWVAILDEEDQDEESGGSLGDWAKLGTLRSSHPIYFAKKLEEVVSDDPVDCMEQPSSGLSIHGLLRPAFIEEHSVIQKHISGPESIDVDTNLVTEEQLKEGVQINGHGHEKEQARDNPSWDKESEKDETLENGFAFYKLEMVKIQLFSALGKQTDVDIEDFRKVRPDAIAHSAAKIILHLKSGGEKTTQALKSLCLRCKGIQVEECALIGMDSLGFDLRVCSGTQVQTLRFAFKKRATSEYSAERQLNDMLFPREPRYQQKIEAQQTES